jgi:hypothetical protein
VKFLKNILAIAALEFQMMAVTDLVVLKIREDFQDIPDLNQIIQRALSSIHISSSP